MVYPSSAKRSGLRIGLDALGDDLCPNRCTHLKNGRGHRSCRGSLVDIRHECAVELDHVNGETLQPRQGRISRAEVVDCDLDTLGPKPLKGSSGESDVVHECALGHLDHQCFGGQPRAAQDVLDPSREEVAGELAHRDVDCDVDAVVALQGDGVRARRRHHPLADRHDEAALLGDRDEVTGRNEPLLRMPPSQQRLGTDHALIAEVHDRLIRHVQLPGAHRPSQPILDFKLMPDLSSHRCVVESILSRASASGVCQR